MFLAHGKPYFIKKVHTKKWAKSLQTGENMSHIEINNIHSQIWMNGHMLPWDSAKLHILSHGLNNASCVFEGMRAYNGKIFRLEDHMQRFLNSANELGIELPFSLEELVDANKKLILSQNIKEGYIRPIAWLGNETLGISAIGASINVAIAAVPWPSNSLEDLRISGVSLGLSTWVKPAPNMTPYKAKAACHYVLSRLSYEAAKRKSYDDALLLDYRGYVAESTGSNIFFVTDNALLTPIADCFLNGITRQTVIEIAKQNNMKVFEKHIHPNELFEFKESFLSGTAYEIMPVRKIGSIDLKVPGEITKIIQEAYRAAVLS